MAAAVRLATFNLKDFFEPREGNGVDERPIAEAKLANVAASLRRARADVVALQEVGSTDLLVRLVGMLPELGYGEPVVGSADRRGIRNAVLSRLPVVWSQVHEAMSLPFPSFVEGDPEPFPGRIPLRRGVVHVRVEEPSFGEVDVMTAHFKSGLPTPQRTVAGAEKPDLTPHAVAESALRSHVQRSAEALFLRGLVDGVFAHSPDHAICVMGDLNDTLDSLPVRLVRGIDVTSRHCLRACVNTLTPERRFSVCHDRGKILIDHVLLSERLHDALVGFEIHNEELRDHGPHVPNQPLVADSDHALSVVELGAPS
jgi:endonuclease/exonuclease/phosphatase family metal-dependent hydrolase